MLEIGAPLPDLRLPGPDGEEVRLRDRAGEKALVVYFYPKDDTPICTTQAKGFRDEYEAFRAAGAEVVGISDDSPASHEAFARKHGLPFLLLSDVDGKARAAFGVEATLGILPGRATFVADKEGRIRFAYSAQFRGPAHVKKALEVVQRL